MANTITFCRDNPIRTTLDDWMLSHIGRVSVGREIDDDHLEILAYSDNRDDWPELSRMAKRENATHIKSVISEGVTVVE